MDTLYNVFLIIDIEKISANVASPLFKLMTPIPHFCKGKRLINLIPILITHENARLYNQEQEYM